jgi:hypothetical protein
MPDPWTTPGRPNATRYVCPLGDWYYDEPSEPPYFGIVGYEARVKDTEALIRQHLEEHTLEEWARAATRLQQIERAAATSGGADDVAAFIAYVQEKCRGARDDTTVCIDLRTARAIADRLDAHGGTLRP